MSKHEQPTALLEPDSPDRRGQVEAMHRDMFKHLAGRAYRSGMGADTEDVVQDVFVKALETSKKRPDAELAENWYERSLTTTTIDYARKRKRNPQNWIGMHGDASIVHDMLPDTRSESRFDEVDGGMQLERIKAHLKDVLPEEYYDTFILIAFDGYKYEEVAKMLDVKEGTVKSRFSRARRMLKDDPAILSLQNQAQDKE